MIKYLQGAGEDLSDFLTEEEKRTNYTRGRAPSIELGLRNILGKKSEGNSAHKRKEGEFILDI